MGTVRTEMVSAFFRILCTFIYITNFICNTTKWHDDEIPQQQQRSNTSYHSDSHDTTRLPASTVSQPAVMPTTCHVICWPPYMAWKRSIMTKYGVDSSISHVTSRDVQGSDAAKRDANVCSLYAAYCLARIISDPHPWQELTPYSTV